MAPVLTNNATSTLAASITAAATQLTISGADAAKFPAPGGGDWFPVTLIDTLDNMEIVRCTGRAGSVLTIVRAQEGTTAKAFGVGTRVDCRLTSAVVAEIVAMVLGLADSKLDASAYTAADVLAKLKTVDSSGSGLDADYLDGQDSAFYRNADNFNAGTVPDARLPGRLRDLPVIVADANGVTATGYWRVDPTTANMPYAGYWHLQVLAFNGDAALQIATIAGSPGGPPPRYQRARGAGNWGPWRQWMSDLGDLDGRYARLGNSAYFNGNVSAGGFVGGGYGRAELLGGGGSNSGYVAFFAPNGDRVGYIGCADATLINVNAENGRNFNFSLNPRIAGLANIYDANSPWPRLAYAGDYVSAPYNTLREPYAGAVVTGQRNYGDGFVDLLRYRYLQARGSDANYYTVSYV